MTILQIFIFVLHATYLASCHDIELTAKVDAKKGLLKKIIAGSEPLDIQVDFISDTHNPILKYFPESVIHMISSYKPRAKEYILSKPDQRSLNQLNEPSLSKKDELSLSKRDEPSLSKKDELSLSKRDELSLTKKDELSLSKKDELSLSKKDELSLSKKGELSSSSSTKNKDPQKILIETIIRRGEDWLSSTYDLLTINFKLRSNNQTLLKNIDSYKSLTLNYAEKLMNLECEDRLEKEFIIIDLVEFSNRVVYDESIKMLKDLTNGNSSDGKTLHDAIYRIGLRHEKFDFEFLCQSVKLCKPFPGYVDYLSDLLGEISTLPDLKFYILILKLVKLYRSKSPLVDVITGETLSRDIGALLEQMLNERDLKVIRKVVTNSHLYLQHRRRVAKALGDGNHHKLYRVLMDMIDRAFLSTPPKEVESQFEATIKGLQTFNLQKKFAIEDIMAIFVDYSLLHLDRVWHSDVKMEVRTILDIALHGKTDRIAIKKYLLVKGSNFIN